MENTYSSSEEIDNYSLNSPPHRPNPKYYPSPNPSLLETDFLITKATSFASKTPHTAE